jgi:hypothetical protein
MREREILNKNKVNGALKNSKSSETSGCQVE